MLCFEDNFSTSSMLKNFSLQLQLKREVIEIAEVQQNKNKK